MSMVAVKQFNKTMRWAAGESEQSHDYSGIGSDSRMPDAIVAGGAVLTVGLSVLGAAGYFAHAVMDTPEAIPQTDQVASQQLGLEEIQQMSLDGEGRMMIENNNSNYVVVFKDAVSLKDVEAAHSKETDFLFGHIGKREESNTIYYFNDYGNGDQKVGQSYRMDEGRDVEMTVVFKDTVHGNPAICPVDFDSMAYDCSSIAETVQENPASAQDIASAIQLYEMQLTPS